MTPRAADCSACRHWEEGETGWISPTDPAAVFRVIVVNGSGFWCACAKQHKPRFYKPKFPGDFDWGWKRRCENFEPKEQP